MIEDIDRYRLMILIDEAVIAFKKCFTVSVIA